MSNARWSKRLRRTQRAAQRQLQTRSLHRRNDRRSSVVEGTDSRSEGFDQATMTALRSGRPKEKMIDLTVSDWHGRLDEQEIPRCYGPSVVDTDQPDRLTGISVDGDERISSDVGDSDPRGKRGAGYSEGGDVEKVLSAGRVGVELEYSVVAEPSAEEENVVAGAAVHGVVAGSADDDVIAGAGIDGVVAPAAVEAVGSAVARVPS